MTALILLSKFRETEIEIWKPISWAVGYDVSSLGRLRSFWGINVGRGKGNGKGPVSVLVDTPHLISLNGRTSTKPNRAYVKFDYRVSGSTKSTTVHSLVAQAFLPPRPPDKDQINHKNGIKIDNRASNLEWSNQSDNQEHANTYLVKRGSQLPQAKITEDDVREVRRLRKEGWLLKRIASHLVISINSVEQINAGTRWKHVT